jgi:hypothetical protein
MRDIPADIISALESRLFRPCYFVYVGFSDPIRFTSLYSSKTLFGDEYFGLGNLGKVSPISENSDMEPQQMSITIAGVNPTSLSATLSEPYINRDVRVYVGMLNDNGALIADTAMTYFVGKVDEMKVVQDTKGSIEIIARDRLADWNRPRVERYTNASQQARYPGDKGLEFVSQVADKEIIWPASSYF